MEKRGYLVRTQAGVYVIGPKFAQMGARANEWTTLQMVGRPLLWELWRSVGETVNLATLDQGTVLYIEVLESPQEFRFSSRVGSRRPVQVTALGKVLTAFQPKERQEQVLRGVTFSPVTPHTIGSLVQFRQELDVARRQGYALDNEETALGARCVGAPILDSHHAAIGAISVSGPVARISIEGAHAIARAIVSTASAISLALGYKVSNFGRLDGAEITPQVLK